MLCNFCSRIYSGFLQPHPKTLDLAACIYYGDSEICWNTPDVYQHIKLPYKALKTYTHLISPLWLERSSCFSLCNYSLVAAPSLFITALLFHLWSYLQSQLVVPATTRTIASYINILLTRTVNCLLTKQKSYWQRPQRGRECACCSACVRQGKKKAESRQRMTKRVSNVQPFLDWTPTGLSAGTHLSNVLNADSSLGLRWMSTNYKVRKGKNKKRFSVCPLNAYISLWHTHAISPNHCILCCGVQEQKKKNKI